MSLPERPRASPTRLSDGQYAAVLTGIFVIVAAFAAWHHEMWRDELQAWLIARDSASFLDVLGRLKYEGHPALWYACLYVLTRLTWSPVIMQAFHLVVAATTVFLFAWRSPFTRLQKALYPFGYFTLFEYGAINRNYALGVLCITVACVLFERRFRAFVWMAAALALAAQTSVHAAVIVVAMVASLVCEYIFWRK